MNAMNSLGFDKPEKDTRIVVAMSGGVDSSVVAAELHAQGYDVIGITLQLYDHGEMINKKGACCAGTDINDARQVAEKLGIPHYVLNYESRFKQAVMDDFVETYLAGETPIPCVKCNQKVKFKDLLKAAKDLGADAMATGHYVQRVEDELHRGADNSKDQSYFLFATTPEELDFLRFPLGGLSKDETREMAKKHGLVVADKPDSQDICFVPNGNYASVIEKLKPGSLDEGEIMHVNGDVLGTHNGIINFTVGQRRGLDIGGTAEPLYVVALDAENNRVIVGEKNFLSKKIIHIKNTNWLLKQNEEIMAREFQVKLRSANKPAAAEIIELEDGIARVELRAAQEGIAPGQACVVYDGDRVIGGGWIEKAV